MRRLLQGLMILAILLLLASTAAVWGLPAIVRALPGQVRVYLPEEVLRAVTTPLPTALPAPSLMPNQIQQRAESVISTPISLSTETAAPVGTATRSERPAQTSSTPAPTPTPVPTRRQPSASPTPTRTSLPQSVLLQGMKIEPQRLNNCGPTTLSLNLNYYGMDTTQGDVASVVKPHYDDRNVSPHELVDYTNDQTPLKASLYSGGDLLLLKRLLSAGFPVVIEKGYEPDWQGWMGHYLTLVGYEDQEDVFITMDTFLGPWDSSGRAYSYAAIEEEWLHFNNTFFVVYPEASEGAVKAIIGQDLYDPLLMWQHAAKAAQQRIDEDPQNAFAWFNLGSSYSELGKLSGESRFYSAAATAFDQARLIGLPTRMLWYQFQLYEAYLAAGRADEVLTLTTVIRDHQGGDKVEETFFYRGQAQEILGNLRDAAYNYQRALEIKPTYPAAQQALDTINALGAAD